MIPIEQHSRATSTSRSSGASKFLTDYQDARYAERYRALVETVRANEEDRVNSTKLAEAVARYYAKLLAYKDEYEVARLYADGEFEQKIEGMFEGDYARQFHLAPPLLATPDPLTASRARCAFGPWMLSGSRSWRS